MSTGDFDNYNMPFCYFPPGQQLLYPQRTRDLPCSL